MTKICMLLLSLKMKLKTLILLLLSTTLLHAQQINLKGTVIDARSNLPVAATTISIINKNIFCPADDEGKFSITNKPILIRLVFRVLDIKPLKCRLAMFCLVVLLN
jgi:hypothetical protein